MSIATMQHISEFENLVEFSEFSILDGIIKREAVKPVYQPIVSLSDGQIFGYEALSRICGNGLSMTVENMFRAAEKSNRVWELESLCREKALKGAMNIDSSKKLFINVNPNIMHDESFKNGFTKNRIEEYGLNFDNVIFEITERVAISDTAAFLNSIDHYKQQNYKIAIDDVGAGYSGLSVISQVKPDFIKLDMSLIRDIDKDETKQLLCKALVDFGTNAEIKIIAEGVETEEELETLIKLDVGYCQGYFLCVPHEVFLELAPDKLEIIEKCTTKKYLEKTKSSIYPIIGYLSKNGICFSPNETAENVYEAMKLNPGASEFTVIKDNTAVGFMTKTRLNEILGGRYGFTLFSKKLLGELMNRDFLRVNYNMPINQVSALAMQRPYEQLYDPIVVEKGNIYSGTVTVKDLLESCMKADLEVATHSNPLTGLPGNLLIEKEIVCRVFGDEPYCVTYYDIDNFKAYNDAYGFQNGDLMLALISDILQSCATRDEFIGHIGGDDFIVICDYHEGDNYCRAVIDEFSSKVESLYRDEDLENGFIVSKNRNGVTESFPIATLSVAGITNKVHTYSSIDAFSKDIAAIKKTCKKKQGNFFQIQ
ncbi:MAG: EAL domain-containing protein [Oscillospiraceae bacterium]|nr:EAL domain-containing protein [Oscillospiraceae bacterium]